ncbi:Rrf2 family transcriptional regulator [Erysipelothrix inopinata]|uniref:Rrf2 family transcriptional regulator n=1 Tax=Erysipelothrix inopinata TaxID=225084 RepID=A0A7G9RYH5_9FIRM|nr:Rrf2 family transcriptional regulator [Erysipelothrix inopinata]QNN60650.1 Rrf2 family transcriptional regulator [Erysipelothrix inopinata]
MKLSARTRYGIAAMTYMHINDQDVTTLVNIADHLNISKIYLEQVFSSLKQANLVDAIKGPTGGYFLKSKECNMYNILNALEPSMFEKTPPSTDDDIINSALCTHLYTPLDEALKAELKEIKLKDIAEIIKTESGDNHMYYI